MAQDVLKKLRLETEGKKAVLSKPAFINVFAPLQYDEVLGEQKYDAIVAFVFSLEEMRAVLEEVVSRSALAENGRLLFAYPKKDNPTYPRYIGRDEIFPYLDVDEEEGYACGTRLKFNTMVSLDSTFTVVGLKNEKPGAKKPSNAPSQRVNDYEGRIAKLASMLSGKAAQTFGGLSHGYKKNWTRYVFSAKNRETQDRRLAEATRLLEQGYKSIDLYRQSRR